MKYVKMLSLVAVAATILIAFVGAGTASATVLCKTPGTGEKTGTTCPEGWAYPAGTEIHMVSEGPIVLTTGSSITEISCKKSTIKVFTNNEGSATETVTAGAEVPNLTWEECSTPSGACTTTTVKGGALEIHWIEGTHNGTVTATGVQVTSSCASIFGTIHCLYVFETGHLGVLTGGNAATLDIEEAPVTRVVTSSLCPETAKLDGKLEITTPKPLYVAGHT